MSLAVRLVLLRPHNAENLGAAARAMKNFGLAHWTWVDPVVQDLRPAQRLAVHAADLLDSARIETSLDGAVGDCPFVVGTTSRRLPGARRLTPREAARELIDRSSEGTVALVFGDERNGLSNAELECCHALSAAPTGAEQPSLNLAQAVLLYCYELRLAHLATSASSPAPAPIPATHSDLLQLQNLLQQLLTRSHFLVHDHRHALHDLLAPLARSRLTRKEAQLWQAALHTLLRRLPEERHPPR